MDNLKIDAVKSEPSTSNDSKGFISDQLEAVENIKNQGEGLGDCLKKSFKSSKLQKLIEMVQKALDENPEDKLIIVSQWTGVLKIVGMLF